VTVRQAAERAAVSESLVYAWVADGTLPHTRLGRKGKRGTIRIAVEDLDGILAEFKVGTRPTPPPPAPVKPPRPLLRHVKLKP
jgi:excisionase family DNA binding protein